MLYADLRVLSGRHQGKVISLTAKKFLVGRGEDCHLRPSNDLVSRHHCVFNLDDYSVRLRDLGSTNGTFVNNEKIQGSVTLNTGDQVRIGKLELEVAIKEGVPAAAAAAPQEEEAVQEVLSEHTPAPGMETYQDTGFISESDTAYFQPPQAQPPQPPQPQYAPAPPAGYGYPPPGYPPQGYAPPGMPPAPYMYPGAYPGIPSGYPQYPPMNPPMMPGGYPQYPGAVGAYPPQMMPGGYAPAPSAPIEEPVVEEKRKEVKEMDIRLPDPADTGAKEPTPPGGDQKGGGGGPDRTKNPSVMAQDLINQYVHRRPGG